MRLHDEPALSARYRALGQAPEGSLGRAYHDFIVANGYSFPGEKGAAAEAITFHDMTHVLSGYGTTPQEEILVVAFSAGYSRQENFNWLMFVLMQFQLGMGLAPGVEAESAALAGH